MAEWKQERPSWCPHADCQFRLRVQDSACAGHLPTPEPHDDDFNHHRLCLNGVSDNGGVFDLQVNNTDLWHLRRLFDALDGKNTANRPAAPTATREGYKLVRIEPTPEAWERAAFNLSSEFTPEFVEPLQAFAKAFWREMLATQEAE